MSTTDMTEEEREAGVKDYTLPDGYEIRVYPFVGIDAKNDAGEWITIASTPDACAELARLAMLAADGGPTEREIATAPAYAHADGGHDEQAARITRGAMLGGYVGAPLTGAELAAAEREEAGP